MRYSISNTAEYGDLTRVARSLIDETVNGAEVKTNPRRLFQSGRFRARMGLGEPGFGPDQLQGAPPIAASEHHHQMQVGAQLRGMMPWLQDHRALVDRTKN